MKAHGISADFHYEVFDGEQKLLEDVNESKLKGYIVFENLKTGKVMKLPFRSFVDNFIQTIHGWLSGDRGVDTKLQTVSLAANSTTAASLGIILGSGDTTVLVTDTALATALAHASLAYDAHVFTGPFTSGYDMGFNVSRILTNNKASTIYPTEVGVMTRVASTASMATPGTGKRMIAHDLVSLSVPADDAVRVTFSFEASQDATQGGIVLNFAKFIYNILFKGNLNHTSSRIVSRSGGFPTYISATTAASIAATLGELFVGSSGTGYIGICMEMYNADAVPISPTSVSVTPDHTGLTASANTISAIEYATISNGAAFTITRTFQNTGTTTKILGRACLLTRGDSANVTGATLSADQALLIYNNIGTNVNVTLSPGQSIRLNYKLGIEA